MRFRPLTLTREDGVDIEYDINTIENIVDEIDRIIIIFKDKSREVLSKDNYMYSDWSDFREQILRTFILER